MKRLETPVSARVAMLAIESKQRPMNASDRITLEPADPTVAAACLSDGTKTALAGLERADDRSIGYHAKLCGGIVASLASNAERPAAIHGAIPPATWMRASSYAKSPVPKLPPKQRDDLRPVLQENDNITRFELVLQAAG